MRYDSFKDMVAGGKLHLFSVYADFGAHRRIKWTTGEIAKLAGPQWRCSSEMWKLDSLVAEPMKKMLACDGANADVIIAVVGSLEQPRPELIDWLDSLTPADTNRPAVLIGLLGDEDDKTEELDWTAKQLIRCAKKLNRKFIWHWMGHHAMDDSDWLTESVDFLVGRKQAPAEQPVLEAVA
jgi:hypothetical protein